jgi:hypothetical protein
VPRQRDFIGGMPASRSHWPARSSARLRILDDVARDIRQLERQAQVAGAVQHRASLAPMIEAIISPTTPATW